MTTEVKPKEQRNVYKVPASLLTVNEGFNKRYDYGEIAELAESIKQNGVKQPLTGHRGADKSYVITDGHRRFKAIQLLVEQGHEDIEVPFITEPKGYSEVERVFDMIILNDGKPLNMLEESDIIKRLLELEVSEEDIAKKIGKSSTHLTNLKILMSANKKLKDNIRSGAVSATAVLEMLRKTGGDNDAVEGAVSTAIEENDGKPVSNRHLKKSAPEVAPKQASRAPKFGLDELRQLEEQLENMQGAQDKKAFEVLQMIIRFGEGRISLVELGQVFLESEDTTEA